MAIKTIFRELPKLKWVKEGASDDFVVRDEEERLLWHVFRSDLLREPMWVVYDVGGVGRHRGYARTVEEAKAIAQAFADAETLRGEGG